MDEGLHEGLYDEATERRIDGVARRRVVPPVGRTRRAAGAGALLTAVALGLQEVFDPSDGEEIILEVDLAGEPDHGQPVTLDFDPHSATRTRAHVRPWLLPAPA